MEQKMSNILRVTTPPGAYENPNQLKSGQAKVPDPAIQGAVNVDKVMKPDARSDAAGQEHSVEMKFKYESNYEMFLGQMGGLTNMSDEFSKVFMERFGTLAESGLNDEFVQKIAQFFEQVSMSETEIQAFLKQQAGTSIKFNGPFFSLLRQVFEQTQSTDLKSGILDFLKKYTNYAESKHLLQSMDQLLSQISRQMFRNPAGELEQLLAKLNYNLGEFNEGMSGNLDILKNEILPFLGKYVSTMNDRGGLRDAVALLASYIARCENGTSERVIDAFHQLMNYQGMQKVFLNFDPAMLLNVLKNTDYEKCTKKQKWQDTLADLVRSGMDGDAGLENKAIFKNLMQSIVLNESVYMPVLHMMLPVHVGGKMMFAEMWIDPDASNHGRNSSDEKVVQGLVKFDIQDMGLFDLFFIYHQEKISIQLNCPKEFQGSEGEITNAISQILASNGLKADELYVGTEEVSIPISAAFPKIFERKNSVNVTI